MKWELRDLGRVLLGRLNTSFKPILDRSRLYSLKIRNLKYAGEICCICWKPAIARTAMFCKTLERFLHVLQEEPLIIIA